MEYLRKVVRTNKEPDEKEVLWVDTAHPDYPVMKYYENGNWKLIRQREDGVAYIMPYGGIPYSDLSQEVKMAIASGGAQANWNQTNSASPDFIWNKPYIPTALADLTEDSNHKFVSATEKTSWSNKAEISDIPDVSGKADKVQSAVAGHIATLDSFGNLIDSGKGISDINPLWGNIQGSIENQTDLMSALNAKYEKPSTGIPASDLESGVIPDVSNFITKNVNDLTYYYTKTEVDSKVASTYKPAGSVANVGSLASLTAANLGKVYNFTASFTTTSDFVEGAGKTYPIGTNVVIVDVGTAQSPSYKYDVLAGFVDLSGYAQTTDVNTALAGKQSIGEGPYFPHIWARKEGDIFILTEPTWISVDDDDVPYTQEMGGDMFYLGGCVDEMSGNFDGDGTITGYDIDGTIFFEDNYDGNYTKLDIEGCEYVCIKPGYSGDGLSFYYVPGVYVYQRGMWMPIKTMETNYFYWNLLVDSAQRASTAYQKPSGGIPKTDLASAVQTSLGKADTAYQKPQSGIPAADIAAGVIPTIPTDIVKYSQQSLTDEQKTQARTNIGAGTYSKPSGGIPASDIAPGVIPAGVTVDQTYDPTSQNAQSGVAIAGALAGKQDTINDLQTIRSGASAGATAYQKPQTGIPASDLAAGVIPTVPTDVVKYSSQSLTDAQKGQARTNIGAGTYSKPSDGIPATDLENGVQLTLDSAILGPINDDIFGRTSEEELTIKDGSIAKAKLASGVQTSLGKADSAYQKPSGGIPASDLASGVIPTVPTALSQLSDDSTHRLVTDTEKSTWSGKQDAIDSTHKLPYSLISDTPTIPAAQVQTDWNASSGMGVLLNKPTLATVATSGSYNDLSNKPDEVEANPTVPSGTTPTSLTGLKIGNNYYDVDTGTEIITFTCGSNTYQAEDGMSWGEWVDSGYNTSYFEAESPYVVDSNGDYINYNNISQMLTDKIIASAAYSKSAIDKHAVNIVKVGNTSYSPDRSTGIVSLPAYPTVEALTTSEIDTIWSNAS